MNGRILLLVTVLILLLAARFAAQGATLSAAKGPDPSLSFGAVQDEPGVTQDDTSGVTPSEATYLLSGYSLAWWTADAGGASYCSAGSYTLGGTAGQTDAAPERSDSNGSVVYTLRAGFWQPSCVAAAAVTAITRAVGNPNTVTLSWTHNAANQTYQVHRATTPYFTPVASTLQETVTAGPWSDDEDVIGDPNTNYFYLVRATCGAAYVDPSGGGRRGEFDFRLAPGD